MSIIDGYAQEMRRQKPKDKKIFLVTSGEYSDYGINAIFSTRKKAQSYIDTHVKNKQGWGEFEIEEWLLDGEEGYQFRFAYRCEVDLRNLEPRWREWTVEKMWAKPSIRSINDIKRGDTPNTNFVRFTSFVSAKHAHNLCIKELQKISNHNAAMRGDI